MKRIFTTTLLIGLFGLLNLTAQERIYTPELSLPENGAVDQMPDVVLDWDAVTGGNTGIIQYDIQLDSDPAFPNPINFTTEFLTAVQASNLFFSQVYYWHVRAKDGNEVSGWSETRSFRVIRRPVLVGPNDASLQNDTVKISWNSISGVTEYDYQFDTINFWKSIGSGTTSKLYGVSVVDQTHTWIVGAGGLVLSYDGTTFTEQESNISTDLKCVQFLDANNGWAVGLGGKIIYFNGTSWTTQTSGTTNDLFGVSMSNAGSGWAVGKNGIILHYDGSSWSPQDTTTKDLNKVFALDANHVWAVGKQGLIVFYNGSAWSVQETGSVKDLLGVGFIAADKGWVVGKSGFMLQYDGTAWKAYEQSFTTKDLANIYFSAPDNGWAVGVGGVVLQYDGFEWFLQTGGTTTNLSAVGLAGTEGFIVGDNGLVLKDNAANAFSSPMATIQHVSGTLSSKNVRDLLFGTQYFWRVRAKHIYDNSEWSGAQSFNTRATVTLDKPDDNAVDQNLDQLLSWKQQFSSNVNYEIQLDEDPAFSAPIFLATTNVSINAELLKFGVKYYWRVRALHAFSTSAWTTARSFTTINTVVLTSPANEETDVKLSPLLTWEAQTGIEGYQVVVADNFSFSNPLVDAIVPAPENSFIVPLVLAKDAVYYWWVRAINGLDTSGWSPIWSFRTLPPVGIDEHGLSSKLNIYPNPAENTVYIQLTDKSPLSIQLTITDLVGKKTFEKEILLNSGNKNVPLDVSFLQNGIYMLRMADKENTFTKKLIIKR
jgi:hypothetical protein